jgi:TrkA-N domain/RyR domain
MHERRNRRLSLTRLGRFWRRRGWLVIGGLWAIAFGLGCIGFALSGTSEGGPGRITDAVYRTLQLIPMNSGDVEGAPWQLEVARFLIPLLAAWTAIRALLGLFHDRWQQFLLRFWRDHVIICGLSRKGWLLAQGFAARGERVVVLEADKEHDLIDACRDRGSMVLTGDATDAGLLRQAGVMHAAHLVAVTDDDGVNVEIAVRCQEVLRANLTPLPPSPSRRGGKKRAPSPSALTCTVHLVDPQLHELARTRVLALEEGVPLRLELFNVFERGARLLWSQYGPVRGGDGAAPNGDDQRERCSVHVLVIGLGRLGECLVVHAARDWHTRLHESPCGASGRLRITVVDLQADRKCRALGLHYPQMGDVCDLVPQSIDVHGPEFYDGAFLTGGGEIPSVSAVFICFDDDSLSLRTGLAVHQRLLHASASPPPIVVRTAEAGGLARLVDAQDGDSPLAPAYANLHTFPLLDRTCTPEAILGGTHEVLARGLHEVYRRQQEALGTTAAANPSLTGWEELPAELRESNRAEADGVFRHLATLGYTLIPLADWDAAFFRFPEPEVESLAQMEHQRWMEELERRGFRPTDGPKDLAAKLHPALRPWAELPESERTKTCANVRGLPSTLAEAGFQIVRLAPPAQTAAAEPVNHGVRAMNSETASSDVVARAIHERYRQNQKGVKAPDDPAMQPWEVLPESLRRSNRQQADHIEAILKRVGCGVRPAAGRVPALFIFTNEEVEIMAAVAHEHWAAERRRAGWVAGQERDVARKITPYLAVSYADLPEDVKEWDRQAVRAIPEVLAAAGLEVHRLV